MPLAQKQFEDGALYVDDQEDVEDVDAEDVRDPEVQVLFWVDGVHLHSEEMTMRQLFDIARKHIIKDLSNVPSH